MGGVAGWDHRWVIILVIYLLVRCLLGCLTVLIRRQLSKDARRQVRKCPVLGCKAAQGADLGRLDWSGRAFVRLRAPVCQWS
jgi:hypothetical protein